MKTDQATIGPITKFKRDDLIKRFADNNIFLVQSQKNPAGLELLNFSAKTMNNQPLLANVIVEPNGGIRE